MKKMWYILIILVLGVVLVGCGSEGDIETTAATEAIHTTSPTVSNELSLTELGKIIEDAGSFWTEHRTHTGRFASEHFDFNEQLGYIHVHLLPTSGFSSVDDIRNYLSRYFTLNWAGVENTWLLHSWDQFENIFTEFGGILYAATASQGTWCAWETAVHSLIEQEGSRAIVETRVETRYSATGDQNLAYMTFRFTMIDGLIDSGELISTESAFNYDELEFVDSIGGDGEDAENTASNIAEHGQTIVAAGEFWEDWWHRRGYFYWNNVDPDFRYNDTHSRLLPTSGFSNLNDVRTYLANYFTQSWIDVALGEGSVFIYHDGFLYINTTRAGFPRVDWTTARHELIEEDGNRVVIATTVAAGAWQPELTNPVDVTFLFTLVDGLIYSNTLPLIWFQMPHS